MPPSESPWLSCSCPHCAKTEQRLLIATGSHSVYFLFIVFSAIGVLSWMKCSTFPHSHRCLHICLSRPLCLQSYHLFFKPYLFLTQTLLFPHKVDDQVDCLKPYVLKGFPSPLPFRAALNWAVQRQPSIFGLYSHMELIRL